MKKEIKVFALNDCDWYAATSLKEAIRAWKEETGMTDEELDSPTEVTEQDMDRLKFIDEDTNEKRTFREELKRRIDAKAKFPQFFATTEF